MPHANVWIRKEDWDKWQALESKSEFIHLALNPERIGKREIVSLEELKKRYPVGEVTKEIPKSALRNSEGFCVNGHPIPEGRSKCMGKGCKYA